MNMSEPVLFPGYEPPEPFIAEPDLSADRRRTLRQHADVERGVHPLTGEPTRPDLGTCGECVFRVQWGAHSFPKCHRPSHPAVARNLLSHSASSDVRAWWPACPAFEPREEAP